MQLAFQCVLGNLLRHIKRGVRNSTRLQNTKLLYQPAKSPKHSAIIFYRLKNHLHLISLYIIRFAQNHFASENSHCISRELSARVHAERYPKSAHYQIEPGRNVWLGMPRVRGEQFESRRSSAGEVRRFLHCLLFSKIFFIASIYRRNGMP